MDNGRAYIDVNLELRDLDLTMNQFKIAVLPGGAGGVGGLPAVVVPYRLSDLEWMLDDLDRKDLELQNLINLGEELTNRLLPTGLVRNVYKQAMEQARQDGGVRLRLIIRSPKLAQLPWEFTYDPLHIGKKGREYFLVLNPQVSIVRYEASPTLAPALTPKEPEHLRLLAATANASGMPPLQLDRERRVVEEALSNFNVDGITITWQPFIEDATFNDLSTALKEGTDLFHFAGHGLFEKQDIDLETGEPIGEGKLVLLRDKVTRERFLLKAKDLAIELQRAGVRLAVLGACQSGRRDGLSPWTSVASALLEKGIPAAVAMQYRANDIAAVAFSKEFYTALAAGLTLDEAVWAGRWSMTYIANISPDKNVEWGVPVLYMSSANGILFPTLAERNSKHAIQLRAKANEVASSLRTGKYNVTVGGNVTDSVISSGVGNVIQQGTNNFNFGTVNGMAIGDNARSVTTNISGEVRDSFIVTAGGDTSIGIPPIANDIHTLFTPILKVVRTRPADPDVDSAEILHLVEQLRDEITKGNAANPNKVNRWLQSLASIAPDVWDVAVRTLSSPTAGITEVVRKIADRAKKDKIK